MGRDPIGAALRKIARTKASKMLDQLEVEQAELFSEASERLTSWVRSLGGRTPVWLTPQEFLDLADGLSLLADLADRDADIDLAGRAMLAFSYGVSFALERGGSPPPPYG